MQNIRGSRSTAFAVIPAFLAVLIAAAFPQPICGKSPRKGLWQASATRQIQTVLDRQAEAWNRRDLEGFMQAYWNSPALTFFSGGTKLSSWQSTIERYRQRYQGEGNEMGHLDFSEPQIEVLGPRVAFVRGRWHLKLSANDAGGLFTLIFRKFPGGWKIIHDHTSSA